MLQTGHGFERVMARITRSLRPRHAGRRPRDWPEPLSIAIGAALLGALVWTAFTTRVPDVERLPAEVVFGFLGLYFYSAGFLAARRTGQVGTGGWAGAACGLAFGAAVCLMMYTTAMREGVREAVRSGALDQVAIAVSGLGFFVAMGAVCGVLGARGAVPPHGPRDSRG